MALAPHPNLAGTDGVREQLRPIIKQFPVVRRDRRFVSERWLRHHKIWASERDQQSYHGRSKSYLAVGRRIIENWVTKLKRDLFQADPWFEIRARREVFEGRVSSLKGLFDYFFRTHMRIRRKSGPMLRQLVTYGTSPVHVGWRVDERVIPTLREDRDSLTDALRSRVVRERVFSYLGPTFRPVDLFAFYVWPTTVMDPDQATLLFEDALLPLDRLKMLAKTPIAKGRDLGMMVDPIMLSRLLDQRRDMAEHLSSSAHEKFQDERRRLALKGFTHRLDHEDPGRPFDITLCYWRGTLDLNDEKTEDWWELLIAGDDTPLRVRRNPWWHGRPPWLTPKFAEVLDEFYGYGLPSVFDRLQYWLVDTMDQASDALVYSMNPIAIVDQFKVQDPTSIRFRPGAKWLTEPDGVRFTEPPKETPSIGISAIQTGIALMNDVSNVAPISSLASGGPRGRGRGINTATGAQILMSEALVELRDVVEAIEDQLFIPMMRMMHASTMQCMQDRSLILRIQGAEGAPLIEKRITAADVIGDYEFVWLGSLHALNQQVRAQQMVNFLQIAAQIPPEVFAQQNAVLDLKFLLRSIWSDGFGLRDADRIVKDMTRLRTLDPQLENDLIRLGREGEVSVNPADDDQAHARIHAQLADDTRVDDTVRAAAMDHLQQHIAAFHAKRIMQQQQEQQQQMLQAQPTGPGNGGMGGGSNFPRGRLGQTTAFSDLTRQMPRGFT